MRIACIGGSGHYAYVLQALQEDPSLFIAAAAPGSADESIDKLLHDCRENGQTPTVYEDYRGMLKDVRPDVVVVNCFFGLHGQVNAFVLGEGLPLYAEKPLATNLEELEHLWFLWRDSQSPLACMFGLRYTPWFYTGWTLVQRGAIGAVRLLNAQKSYRLGSRGPHFRTRPLYGGTIPWVGSHGIDWLHWFSGRHFRSVTALQSRQGNRAHGELEVSALCQFAMDDEVLGSVSVDYLRPESSPSHDDDRLRVVGTEGILEIRDRKVFLQSKDADGCTAQPLADGGSSFLDFAASVRERGACRVTGEESFHVTEASLRAQRAADRHSVESIASRRLHD